MVKNRLSLSICASFVVVFLTLSSSTSFAIETVKGILRQNQSPACANHCDDYYLEPDSGIASINLKGSVISSGYVDKHVEITGNRFICSGCITFNVAQISLIVTSVEDQLSGVPQMLRLEQNYPNPFNPSTVIPYSLPEDGLVTIKIFNLLGQEIVAIVSGKVQAGFHRAVWNAVEQPGGMYVSQLTFRSIDGSYSIQTRKMLYIR
ncbi:MAG: T9SS type A sorting domain-containing protein [Ignavibacteria bacterium]|nr:T9SS type A sorting domain-containing protein [Ignavibacteria bacterium]MBI3765339.1 T9SS type A sorting domain-containing protein [Ignavibacteriales bacterium]